MYTIIPTTAFKPYKLTAIYTAWTAYRRAQRDADRDTCGTHRGRRVLTDGAKADIIAAAETL